MKRHGFTLIEMLTGVATMFLVMAGSVAMLLTGLRSFATSSLDVNLGESNAQGLRHIAQALRGAMTASISTDGTRITYSLPLRSTVTNPITGEKELMDPLTSDGVYRTYTVSFTAGTLTESGTGRVLVRNIVYLDPKYSGGLLQQSYTPFQLTTIGSKRAVTINLITQDHVGTVQRYQRMKTTVVIRNAN